MRGLSLTIKILVVIALSVMVLLGITALYYMGFVPPATGISLDQVKNEACITYVRKYRCRGDLRLVPVNFDADRDGIGGEGANNGDNFFYLCINYFGVDCEINQITGDVDGNCIVDQGDNDVLADHWWPGPPPGPLGYDPVFDLNSDGKIDIMDTGIVSTNWNSINPVALDACKKLCGCI